ncbi:MAG: hypothetical protein OIN66_16835 [Candidatus Methanoperedens sp.]|nr:hypothetical protein [Candidatus Methanoperedens sp.]
MNRKIETIVMALFVSIIMSSVVIATQNDVSDGILPAGDVKTMAIPTCDIYDLSGNPISTAMRGDVVELSIMASQAGPSQWNFVFKPPSTNTSMYDDLFAYVRKYSGASGGAIAYMKIQPFTQVQGTGYFIGMVPGQTPCFKALTIT